MRPAARGHRPGKASPASSWIIRTPIVVTSPCLPGRAHRSQEVPRRPVSGPGRVARPRSGRPWPWPCTGPTGRQVGGPEARVGLLASRAGQPAEGVDAPAGADRADAQVALAERGRIGVPGDAGTHLAPHDRDPQLIADHGPRRSPGVTRKTGRGNGAAETSGSTRTAGSARTGSARTAASVRTGSARTTGSVRTGSALTTGSVRTGSALTTGSVRTGSALTTGSVGAASAGGTGAGGTARAADAAGTAGPAGAVSSRSSASQSFIWSMLASSSGQILIFMSGLPVNQR